MGLRTSLILLYAGIFAGVSVEAQLTRAANVKSSRSFVYQGRILRPDGTGPTGSMSLLIKILSPDPKLCVLWTESQTVDLKEGAFSVELGHLTHRLPGASGGAASDFMQAFVNNPGLTIPSAQCASGNSYTPASTDDRLLSATFNDNGNLIEIAGLPIKSVPYALQAEEIGGYGLANLMKIDGAGSGVVFSPAETQTFKDLLGGDVFFDMKSRAVKNVANPTDPQDAATKSWVQSHVATSMSGAGLGTVTNVSVAGGALGVTNASSTPQITLAQASGSASGYLSSADWTTFNGKQAAGSYQTTTLAANQTLIGNGSNVAAAGFFGIEQMRNASGIAQFPAACSASQTLTWSAITDVLVCANIDSLNASRITAGTLASARLGSGTADATTYLRGDGSWQTIPSSADHLGNHTATQNLNLGTYKLVGAGGSAGVNIDASGNVGIGTTSPTGSLEIPTGQVLVPNGLVGAPGISFSGNPDTGIFSSGDNVRFSTGGVVRFITDNSAMTMYQSIILGANQQQFNSAYTLYAPGSDFYIRDYQNARMQMTLQPGANATSALTNISSRLTVDGSVGIGTATPGYALDVNGHINLSYPNDIKMNGVSIIDNNGDGSVRYSNKDAEEMIRMPTGGGLQDLLLQPVGGNVGIGTTTPAQKLEVAGNIRASGQLVTGSQTITGGTTAISFNSGNSISTDYNCASPFDFANLADGGTYTLVVTDAGTTQCNFSTTVTGSGAGTVSYRIKPANAARTASSHTIYTLMRVGSVVYVSWGSGF